MSLLEKMRHMAHANVDWVYDRPWLIYVTMVVWVVWVAYFVFIITAPIIWTRWYGKQAARRRRERFSLRDL